MANLQYLSLPAAATGLAPASGASAWTYGSYVEATASTSTGIYIIGVQLEIETNPAAADATNEILIEIATGAGGAEVTKLQIPFNYRADTITSADNGLGYWMPRVLQQFFPEPYFIPLGTRVAVRATDQKAGAVTYRVKLRYREGQPPTVALSSPADSATGVSTTPALVFTGTDAQSDDVRYEVQAGTSSPVDISVANLTSGNDVAGGSTATTASITTHANKLALATISSRNATSDPNHPTISGWTEVLSVAYDTSAGASQKRLTVLRKLAGSDSTGALTIDFASQAQTDIAWVIDEFTGMDTSGTNGSGAIVQSNSNVDVSGTGTTLSVTLSAFGNKANATYGAIAVGNKPLTVTPGSGFTKISDGEAGLNGIHVTGEFRADNDTTVDFTSSLAGELGIIGIELKSATPLTIDAVSGTDAGFSGTPDNTDPFTSGQAVTYTVQSALSNSTTYYWRVRGKDPSGSNTYGAWATTRSFTTASAGGATVYHRIALLGVG